MEGCRQTAVVTTVYQSTQSPSLGTLAPGKEQILAPRSQSRSFSSCGLLDCFLSLPSQRHQSPQVFTLPITEGAESLLLPSWVTLHVKPFHT